MMMGRPSLIFLCAIGVIGGWLHAVCPQTSGQAITDQNADQIIAVFDDQAIEFDKTLASPAHTGDVRLLRNGQQIERTLALPAAPANQRDARRIVATLIIEPVVIEEREKVRPADPWTRLGSVTIASRERGKSATAPVTTTRPGASSQPASRPGSSRDPASGAASQTATQPTTQPATQPAYPVSTVAEEEGGNEIEIMRFVTPFGGPATFTADLTAFAPLLNGSTTLRVWISTWRQPAWRVTLTLTYTSEGAGYRRPTWAKPVFNGEIKADKNRLRTSIAIPHGLARPRLQVLSTGHATDGAGGDEFISRTHVLRIDGVEVTRWRPWREDGGPLRAVNPTSGRMDIDGRMLWASDLDRSGWLPGLLVEPLRIPLAELTPGTHTIELEILNIRPKDQSGYGYWRVSAIAVADEPWPSEDGHAPQ